MADFSPQAPPLVPVTNIRYGQKKGREVGGHHLACDFPFHHNNHAKAFFACLKGFVAQIRLSNMKDRHI